LVREVREAGRTVFLSSHIMSEVEAVADMVGILRQGRLIVVESVDKLKAQSLRRIELTFDGPAPAQALRGVPGVRDLAVERFHAQLMVEGSTADLFRTAAPYGVANIVTHEPDLEEIFLAYYDQKGGRDSAEQRVRQEPARPA
ncbi:MAG TPA: ABC transporter ATP-binding protein, partial [Micromonosporaceae bacterium]